MKTKEIEKNVARVAGSLFGSDKLMMKKRVTVDDYYYRKNDPDRILWHGKWSAEVNVCVLAVCILVAAAGALMAIKGMSSKIMKRKKN